MFSWTECECFFFLFFPVYKCKKSPASLADIRNAHSTYNAFDISFWHVMYIFINTLDTLCWFLFSHICVPIGIDATMHFTNIMNTLWIFSYLPHDTRLFLFTLWAPFVCPPPFCVPIGTEATMHSTYVINIFCISSHTHHDTRHFSSHFCFFFPIWVPNGTEDTMHSTYKFLTCYVYLHKYTTIVDTLCLFLFSHICVPIGIDAIMHWTNIINILCIFWKIHHNTRHFLSTLFFVFFPIWTPFVCPPPFACPSALRLQCIGQIDR